MGLYPVHLELDGRQALVVGGGEVAVSKARGLLEAGARVRVVAPCLSEAMKALAAPGRLTTDPRPFAPDDLDGASIAIGATDDPGVHDALFREARARRIAVAIVDDPSRSDFIAPAVLRRGELVVTVSTSGAAPALAARLRDRLAEIIGENYGEALGGLRRIRGKLRERYPDFAARRSAWYRLLDSHVIPALERGEVPPLDDALARIEETEVTP